MTWACEKAPREFTRSQALNQLKIEQKEFEQFFHDIVVGDTRISGGNPTFALSEEAFYRYIEVIELMEARKTARQARLLSIAAISISVVLGAVGLLQNDVCIVEIPTSVKPVPMLQAAPK